MKVRAELIRNAAITINTLADELTMIAAATPDDERELDVKLDGIDEAIYELRTALRHLKEDEATR